MKNKISSILLLFAMLTAFLPQVDASAQTGSVTVDIQPDGASAKYTVIVKEAPGTRYGTYEHISIGEHNTGGGTNRELLEFNLSALPRDVIVESATLELTVKEDHSDNARTMNVYALNNNWKKAEASWQWRYGYTEWQTAGAEGADDVLQTPIGTASVTANQVDGDKVLITFTDMDAIAAMFKQNLFGFKMQMETEYHDQYTFYSPDSATTTNRPKLTLTYTVVDPDLSSGWTCVNVSWYAGCTELELAMGPHIPFQDTGTEDRNGYSGPATETQNPQTAALLNCTPYPRCINDYPIYYRFTYDVAWVAGGGTAAALWMRIVTNRVDAVRTIDCGTGSSAKCKGFFEGVISISDLPENLDAGYTLALSTGLSFPSSWFVTSQISWHIEFSQRPFDQNCAEIYSVPVPETYIIDPILETPLGINGTPADHQMYPTVIGQLYMVKVERGPWNDGVDDRTDAAVSLDGTEWMTWDAFSVDAVCIDLSPVDPENNDYRILYFRATTETFYIRSNDTAGAFADNTNNLTTPYQYEIGIAFELGKTNCESQYTYDPLNDTIATVTVPSTSTDAEPSSYTEPMIGGQWYAVQVTSGTWHENTPVTERVDMESAFSGTIGSSLTWADLAEGSALVQCASEDGKTIYIQAPSGTDLSIHLRVNDQDTPQNFADNTGTLQVSIYKTTYTRQPNGCELQFDISTFVSHGEVAGNAANGMQFATVLSTSSDNGPLPDTGGDMTYSYGLTPGGWYMLETTGGPWYQTFTGGGYNASTHYYDVKLRSGTGGDWFTPETWPDGECAIKIDALGHQRIYFQAPANGIYYIKAAGAGPFTRGGMSWDLYQAIDLQIGEASSCQDYVYDPNVATAIGTVDSTLDGGTFISGLTTNSFAAVQIESANTASDPPYYQNSGWYESAGATEQDDLEFTIDGNEWVDLPNHPAVLCYYYTPETNELVFIFRPINGQTPMLRANSTTFNNNVGIEYYRTFAVTAGDTLDPWTSCSDDYQATVPAINESEWIPPQDEEGVNLMPTLTYTPGQDPNNDGIIFWGNPGLESGHLYMVETQQGPWYDQLPKDQGSYKAQLSSDGGATWYLFNEHPDVICSKLDQMKMYQKAIFSVTEGQQWKIRVADTETDVFTDNSGNLAYRLTLVNEFPVNGPGDLVNDYDPGAFDMCSQSLVRPTSLTLSEIGSLGNYFGDWVQYINRSLLSYFAWCPRHTDMLISAMNALKTREPLATIYELRTVQKNIVTEVDSYDWEGGGFQDTSIFDANSGAEVQAIFENIIPQSGSAVSPWEDGGDLVQFTAGTGLPAYYYTCDNVFADYLPSRLRVGVCFTSAYWKETGASFWVQLSLDIGAIFALVLIIKRAVQSLVYMMTGVRPWTKDGASKMIVEVANGRDLVQPVENWRYRR